MQAASGINDVHRTFRRLVSNSRFMLTLRAVKSFAEYGHLPNKPLWQQTFELLSFISEYKVHPRGYYWYRVYANWDRRNEYIFDDEIIAVLHYLNSRVAPIDSTHLRDKRKFFERCNDAQLPCVPIIARFESGDIFVNDTADVARDLFSKPAASFCGIGATAWPYSDNRYQYLTGAFTFDELQKHLANTSINSPIILQPRISNHKELRPISGRALSTVRLLTVKRPDKPPEVALAAYRMGTGKSSADNFNAEGLASPISLSEGKLGPAVRKDGYKTGKRFDRHPDTGSPIEGRVVPDWAIVKDLGLRAHAVFDTVPSIGWDVAVTERGPVLVEGNDVWGIDICQMTADCPISETTVPEVLSEYLVALEKSGKHPH